MNKWRYVQYEDDGVEGYQCLHCKGNVSTRDMFRHHEESAWKFCPHCGTGMNGFHECREHYVPRWVYDRWGNNYPDEVDKNIRSIYQTPRSRLRYIVESRIHWFGEDPGPWACSFDYGEMWDVGRDNYRVVIGFVNTERSLQSGRRVGGIVTEYRIRTQENK